MDALVYTLGTSNRSQEEFVALLRQIGAEAVVDVRRFPTSRFEHFRQEELAKWLQQEGIGYHHLGAELGGYRKGGYLGFAAGEEFSQGLEALERIAKVRRIAIVCAERLPWRCHRRLIGAELEARGWHVVHVIDEKRAWSPRG